MDNPPKKRRRFSFSLRTLFVFMLVVGVLLGFIGMRLKRAREQQTFLKELRESGWVYLLADGWDEPNMWELVIDSNFIDHIDIINMPIDTGRLDLSLLADLKNLEELIITSTQVTDLAPLTELRNLWILRIDGTQVTDLTPLYELKNLQRLYAADTLVSDLSSLKGLKNLRWLFVSNTRVSDLTPLTELKNLQRLHVLVPRCRT